MFTVKHEGVKYRLHLTSLYPDRSNEKNSYFVSCGAYDKQGRWTGVSFRGNVPVPEFIRWAKRKKYIKIEVNE